MLSHMLLVDKKKCYHTCYSCFLLIKKKKKKNFNVKFVWIFFFFHFLNRLISHGSEAKNISHAINLKQKFIGEKYDVFTL